MYSSLLPQTQIQCPISVLTSFFCIDDHYDFPTTSPNTQSGHPGHTTKEQDAAVHQLRMTLEQQGYQERLDTLTLLRFLRARKFNVELSKTM